MGTQRLKRIRTRSRTGGSNRSESGWQMVELLIALLIAGFVGVGIMKGFSQLLFSTTSVHNQIAASDIAQQVMDNARNQTYDQLVAEAGSHTLVVNDTAGATLDPVFPRALLQDQVNLTYRDASKTGRFKADVADGGIVTATILNNNDGTARVHVHVEWSDPGSGRKTYNASTLIAENGIHN